MSRAYKLFLVLIVIVTAVLIQSQQIELIPPQPANNIFDSIYTRTMHASGGIQVDGTMLSATVQTSTLLCSGNTALDGNLTMTAGQVNFLHGNPTANFGGGQTGSCTSNTQSTDITITNYHSLISTASLLLTFNSSLLTTSSKIYVTYMDGITINDGEVYGAAVISRSPPGQCVIQLTTTSGVGPSGDFHLSVFVTP